MDKKLILAVAGAGKTTSIINKLNENDSFLIVTYTKNNYEDIKKEVIKKFNGIPEKIKIYTYFSFLYNFCFKPFEKLSQSKGIQYSVITEKRANSKQIEYYMNRYSKKMFSARLSKLCNDFIIDKVIKRIERYFNNFFIDEIQDFAGNDFDFIKKLINCNSNILYVGDFYQHTFNTSRDGNKNCNLFDDYDGYLKIFLSNTKNFIIDNKTLIKSRRCTKSVCDFVRNEIKIDIYSEKENISIIREIVDEEHIKEMMQNNSIIKLFYKNSKKYNGNTENWGNSKGKTYENICVILNDKTYKLFKDNNLSNLAPSTKNKFYVACTRTKNNLFFIQEKKLNQYINNE